MPKWIPDQKWLAGGIGGVVTWLVLMIAAHFGVAIPADVQAALPGLVALVLHYAVPPSEQDVVKRVNDKIIALAQQKSGGPSS